MRILLDENLDWRLCRELSGNEVTSVSKTDLAGLNNGALLAKAEEGFDVFVTIDAGLPYQQNIQSKKIAVVVLKAKTNRRWKKIAQLRITSICWMQTPGCFVCRIAFASFAVEVYRRSGWISLDRWLKPILVDSKSCQNPDLRSLLYWRWRSP